MYMYRLQLRDQINTYPCTDTCTRVHMSIGVCAKHVLRYACEMHCIEHDIIYDSAYTIDRVRHHVVLTVIASLH